MIEVLNHYVKEISFEKTQMTDKEMTNILEFQKAKILIISNFLMSIEPLVGTVQSRYIEYSASKQMYFNFTKEYQPLKTPPDGNCLYHMISLCLIGNTTLMLMLRVLTVFSLLNLKAEIMQLLKWEYETTHSDNQGLDNYLDHEYIDILNSARCLSHFGNQYHLLVISTFIQKNIYIYSQFPDIMSLKNLEFSDLKKHFDNSLNSLGLHLKYTPIKNSLFTSEKNRTTIYGFYDLEGKHYSAILPAKKDLLQFIPKNEWFGF
jgi:hypothetical protein